MKSFTTVLLAGWFILAGVMVSAVLADDAAAEPAKAPAGDAAAPGGKSDVPSDQDLAKGLKEASQEAETTKSEPPAADVDHMLGPLDRERRDVHGLGRRGRRGRLGLRHKRGSRRHRENECGERRRQTPFFHVVTIAPILSSVKEPGPGPGLLPIPQIVDDDNGPDGASAREQ